MRKYQLLGVTTMVAAILFWGNRARKSRSRRHQEHTSETEQTYRTSETRILILGAGFGGLSTALKLDQEKVAAMPRSVLVVDRNNDLLFSPLLWTVANGCTNPNNVLVPVRDFQKGRHFHFLHAEVEHIDLERKVVQTSTGERPYDYLVIALGSHTTIPDLPGLRTYAHLFHTSEDALQLRNHLIDAVEAAHYATNQDERREWLTFVVGGAGDTGVELAAIIHDYITTGLFGEYPWLENAPVRVIVVGKAERILPMSKPETSQLVAKTLTKEGIEILAGTAVEAVTERTVETSKGSIAARTFFWAAGITAQEVIRQLPVQHAHNGAIIVDDHLRIPGHPQAYVIGDSVWGYDSVTGEPVPATAQAADQQGNYVGETIAAEIRQEDTRPYQYTTLGHLALLGRYTGVAQVGPITFAGLPAWILWHLAYLQRDPSWTRRIRLVLDWLLAGVLGRETGQLRLTNPTSYEPAKKMAVH